MHLHLPGKAQLRVPYDPSETERKIEECLSRIGIPMGYLLLEMDESDIPDTPNNFGYMLTEKPIYRGRFIHVEYFRYGNIAPDSLLERALGLLADDEKIYQKVTFYPNIDENDFQNIFQNIVALEKSRNGPVELNYGLLCPEERAIGEFIVARFPKALEHIERRKGNDPSYNGDREIYRSNTVSFGTLFEAVVDGFEQMKF